MALTDGCDVFASVHEAALNRVVTHVTRQRPSLVNLGTPTVRADPRLLCTPITPAHPVVVQRKNPLIGVAPDLPVPGTPLLFEYAVQVAKAEVDVSPGSIGLPPELAPLPDQRLAVHGRVCAGLGCPVRDREPRPQPPQPPTHAEQRQPERRWYLPFRELECFCLDLFATLGADFAGPSGGQHLVGTLDGLELVDLAPTGLEDAIECYAKTAIRFALLPGLSVPLIWFQQASAGVATVTVEPTVPPAVAHNPALDQDALQLCLDVTATPDPGGGGGGGGGGSSPPPSFPGSPRGRSRSGAFDAQAALSERAVDALFTAVQGSFGFNETTSGDFGPFTASATAAGHLENGTIDLRSDGTIALDELDLQFDALGVCLGVDIPKVCVGGWCIVGIPFDGCAVRLPEICAFSDDPDLELCLDIAPFVRFELSATLRPVVRYSVNPGRTPGMNDWDAHDAGLPNHWQLYVDPGTIDLDLLDLADAVGDLLDDALDAALDTVLGPLPGWAKDLIKALLGPVIDVVRTILDFGDDFSEWLADLLGVGLGLGDLVLQLLADHLAAQRPLLEFADPIELMPADGPLIPVLVPLEFIGARVDADEMVLEIDVGDSL